MIFRRTRLALLFLIAVAVPGCLDGIGVATGCREEMEELRRQRGPPDEAVEGNRTQIWLYGIPPTGVYYEFRWDSSGETCEVRGPESLSRMESTLRRLFDR